MNRYRTLSNEGCKSKSHTGTPQVPSVIDSVSDDSSCNSTEGSSQHSSERVPGDSQDTVVANAPSPVQAEYRWPPQKNPDLSYRAKSRNPVHSIVTALPIIMLVTGLYIYFKGEAQQTQNMPIRSESVDVSGTFTGISQTSNRHYLWLDVEGEAKGVRIKSEQLFSLQTLVRDVPIDIKMAPSVQSSNTFWVWHVEQSGKVFMDAAGTLR